MGGLVRILGEVFMTDDAMMRMRLQRVVAYRALCQSVRSSGRTNVFFALLMLYIAYSMFQLRPPNAGGQLNQLDIVTLLYGGLAVAELLVGIFKWFAPSAEGVLFDAIILVLFVCVMLVRVMAFGGGQPNVFTIVIGGYLGFIAISKFKNYIDLRKLFADRPSREQIAWFDELIHEIRAATPETDDLAIDLPTKPHWKAKLFGSTAFFVAVNGKAVWVTGPGEFDLARERKEHGTGKRRALLTIHGQHYPEFPISDASWANYQKWLAENSLSPQNPN